MFDLESSVLQGSHQSMEGDCTVGNKMHVKLYIRLWEKLMLV